MAQVNPQLMAMLQAMAQNPNADRPGSPVLGGHPGTQTVNNDPWSGNVQGGDGARTPTPGPENGGIYGAPGEAVLGGQFGGLRPPAEDPNDEQNTNNSTSLLGPHGTNAAGILAGLSAILSPGQYNTRHPLTLMKQINPGLISQASKSGGSFGNVDQQATQKQNVIAQLLAAS